MLGVFTAMTAGRRGDLQRGSWSIEDPDERRHSHALASPFKPPGKPLQAPGASPCRSATRYPLEDTRGGTPARSQASLRRVQGLAHVFAPWLIVPEDAPAGALEVFELSAVERPKERREAKQAQKQRARNEPDQRRHHPSSRCILFSRTALAVTATEEADMAIAAKSGVTRPAMAIGTNKPL